MCVGVGVCMFVYECVCVCACLCMCVCLSLYMCEEAEHTKLCDTPTTFGSVLLKYKWLSEYPNNASCFLGGREAMGKRRMT